MVFGPEFFISAAAEQEPEGCNEDTVMSCFRNILTDSDSSGSMVNWELEHFRLGLFFISV